nr:hypothetical protein [uncultured Kingella sp.]
MSSLLNSQCEKNKPRYKENNVVLVNDYSSPRKVLINGRPRFDEAEQCYYYPYQSDDGIGEIREDYIQELVEEKFYPNL